MHKGVLLFLLCLLPLTGHAQRDVIAWTYHLAPPFILELDSHQGLSYDLVELLNRHPLNQDRYRFRLIYLPRKRLDMHLKDGIVGLVLWVNPAFFTDEQNSRYQWSAPLLHDRQEFVSRRDRPFDYRGPESLHGRLLGGVLGHRYQGIQEDIDKGLIAREDVPRDEQNLDKLLSGRIDLILTPRSTVRFYTHQQALDGKLHLSPRPLSEYERKLLLHPGLTPDVREYLQHVVADLPENPDWHAVLKRYGLSPER